MAWRTLKVSPKAMRPTITLITGNMEAPTTVVGGSNQMPMM